MMRCGDHPNAEPANNSTMTSGSPMEWTMGSKPRDKPRYSFDHMLQKFESGQGLNRSPSPAKYDFAKRAQELRRSMGTAGASPARDTTPSRSGMSSTPMRSASPLTSRDSFGGSPMLAADTIGNNAATRGSFGSRDQSPLPHRAIESAVSFSSPLRNGMRDSLPPVSNGHIRSATSFASPQLTESSGHVRYATSFASHQLTGREGSAAFESPQSNMNYHFNEQIEQFRKNLIYAHDTISALQRDVRSLEQKVNDKDDNIASLERRNKDLKETADLHKKNLLEVEREKQNISEKNEELIRKHAREITEFKLESDSIKNQSAKIDMLSKEHEENSKSMRFLEDAIDEKDQMIGELRKEIWRLNEEVSDGNCVREQAKKAEERALGLHDDLRKAKKTIEESSNTIAELKAKINDILSKKDKEQAEFENSQEISFAERTNRLKEKVAKLQIDLDKAQTEKDEADDKVKELERRINRDEKEISEKGEEIMNLKLTLTETEARENELESQLAKTNEELASQRAKFELYNNETAIEQETVEALEHAIEQLEKTQNEKFEENERLKQENATLSKTVEDAELCISSEIGQSSKLKQMLDELAEINHDLGEQLRSKEDCINAMKTTEDNLTSLLKSTQERNERLEAERNEKINAGNEVNQRIQELESNVTESENSLASLQQEYDALRIEHNTTVTKLKCQREESSKSHQKAESKLTELTQLVKEQESEMEKLKADEEKMLGRVAMLENELEEVKNERMSLKLKLLDTERTVTDADEARQGRYNMEMEMKEMQAQLDQANANAIAANTKANEQKQIVLQLRETLEKSRVNSNAAWSRLKELEEIATAGDNKLKTDIGLMEKKLAEKEEQLTQSRKGVAEAQKMIYRLMQTVKEVRRKARDEGVVEKSEFVTSAE